MGSIAELNDTLQLTTEQGFPKELDWEKHQQKPFFASDFEGKVFEFKNKPKIRLYQQVPIRNFLAHNIEGKWLYWGLVHILEVRHNYKKQTTSGKYVIVKIYSPEEMKMAHQIIEIDTKTDFFGE